MIIVGPTHTRLTGFALAIITTTAFGLCRAEAPVQTVSFLTEVRPILEHSCVSCHGPGNAKGALRLHTRALVLKGGESGPAVLSGNAKESRIIQRVTLPEDHDDVMPNKGRHLTAKEIEVLAQWIGGSLYWTEGVVLMDRSAKEPPPPKGNAHSRHNLDHNLEPASSRQLDRLIEADNAGREGLVHADSIDDLRFLRKVSVELIGRIPTHSEINAYLKSSDDERRALALDRLLQHPRFTDRWTAFMADLMRIRTGGRGNDPYENYVRACVEEGVPYDVMVRELISAQGDPAYVPAVGYVLRDRLDPMALASATSQIFLGVRMACAQCHDHPFDKWSQKQFYEFAGFFGKSTVVRKGRKRRKVYTTEKDTMSVRWPPANPDMNDREREPVHPTVPFQLESFEQPPSHIVRFMAKRMGERNDEADDTPGRELNEFFNAMETDPDAGATRDVDVMAEQRAEIASRSDPRNWFPPSVLRSNLAVFVTSPRNRLFSRAIVNRVWAEVMGRGFFEPIDDYRDDTIVSHPRALEYLADEFVASGFDLRALLRLILSAEAYQRGPLGAGVSAETRLASEQAFTAGPARRMISEALFDSMVVAGHLQKPKWPVGANVKERDRRIRYFVEVEDDDEEAPEPVAEPDPEESDAEMAMAGNGENGAENMDDPVLAAFDDEFDMAAQAAMLQGVDAASAVNAMMAVARNDIFLAQQMVEEQTLAKPGRRVREMYRTITETYDDNPSFGSAFKIVSPAPRSHFLRVFGQPARDRLGEFRDQSTSLRQELVLMNGRVSNEAARVGPFEPIFKLLSKDSPNVAQAVKVAYLEILTREPGDGELERAVSMFADAADVLVGMADLRWALMNSHEFRYLP